MSLWALTVTPVIAPAQVKRADPTVYVTRTGHKYHRAGCPLFAAVYDRDAAIGSEATGRDGVFSLPSAEVNI